jgi:hypothetical protein
MEITPPFDPHYPVISAYYTESLGKGTFEKRTNLVKHAPQVIVDDRALYRFPKHVPLTFFENVQEAQKNGNPVIQKIFEHNRSSIFLRYTIDNR